MLVLLEVNAYLFIYLFNLFTYCLFIYLFIYFYFILFIYYLFIFNLD